MPLNTANFVPSELDPSQDDEFIIRTAFALGLAFKTNNKDGIAEAAFAFNAHTNGQYTFAVCRTALALGMSPFKINSFCNIKFQDKTSAMKKWLVAYKNNFGQLNEPQVNITWQLMTHFIYKPDCISTT